VGAISELLKPLNEALRQDVMSGRKLHADDTPVPVLALGDGIPSVLAESSAQLPQV
jgi:hypothetical protein